MLGRLFIFFLLFPCFAFSQAEQNLLSAKQQKEKEWYIEAGQFLDAALADSIIFSKRVKLDTLYKKHGVCVNFSEELAYQYLRTQDVENLKKRFRKALNLGLLARVRITVDGLPLEQYVPLYYSKEKDKSRLHKPYKGIMNVTHLSQPYEVKEGLNQRHIALWNSHGRYYNHKERCWKWQRASLFTTVEDLFTSSYVLPFLLPMLENAGANVYLPRERDVQTSELIVDDADSGFSVLGDVEKLTTKGFKNNVVLDASGINPFEKGSCTLLSKKAEAQWKITIPKTGKYALSVSYVTLKNSTEKAYYEIHHNAGITSFEVNQKMGGGTWIYLDDFFFSKDEIVTVKLRNDGRGVASADAVRVGGGMGSISREGKQSGVPRWQEAARYYLQYAGALDSLTYNRHGDSIDYNDDYRSRARWVNYIRGGESIEPWLLNDAHVDGLSIPIDLSLGLHSDAGHFFSLDTLVGTLGIYSTYDVKKNRQFYDKTSRLVNRDLVDLLQSQLVDDIRNIYGVNWIRREMWDKMYSEATFAEVPSLLLELHSHANALDMYYGLDPQFRFNVSRALYKGVLRFLSVYYRSDYVVQPLPVKELAIKKQSDEWVLRWTPQIDSLEPTASPDNYVVYTRKDNGGWDNGVLVAGENYKINVTDSSVYSFKVTAVNRGGESFSSSVLSMALAHQEAPTVLVIDAFNRVGAPVFYEKGDSVGVAPWIDEGVPYGIDIATIGWQYNYDQKDPWISDDIPGHGGSYNNLSDSLFLGNNFDHCLRHVQALTKAGYNVISASVDAVEHGNVKLYDFDAVDVVLGEQRYEESLAGKMKYEVFSSDFLRLLSEYLLQKDAKVLLTGAHLAKAETEGDIMSQIKIKRFLDQQAGIAFDRKIKPENHHLSVSSDSSFYKYNVDYITDYYRVENADAFSLTNDSAEVIMTYSNGANAAVFYDAEGKVISVGVPFETIIGNEKRYELMDFWMKKLFDE